MYLDIVILVVLLVCLALGWRKGFMCGVLGFMSNAISFAIAIFTAKQLAGLLDSLMDFSHTLDGIINGKGYALNVLISGIVIYLFCWLMFFILKRFIKYSKANNKAIDKIDKFAGLLLGVAQCAVLLFISCVLIYLVSQVPFLKTYATYIFYSGVPGYDKSIVGLEVYNFIVKYVIPHSIGLFASSFTK
jgi:uncharacterized membrane protein required for colicin V production